VAADMICLQTASLYCSTAPKVGKCPCHACPCLCTGSAKGAGGHEAA